jgi:hypothetical protein
VGGVGKVEDVANSKVKWVDENAGMSQRARDYNDTATGTRSNPATQSGQAPALKELCLMDQREPLSSMVLMVMFGGPENFSCYYK